MADDRESYEPLWAQGLRREPGPEPEAPAKPKGPTLSVGAALAIAGVVAIAVVVGVVFSDRSGRVTVEDLQSYWGDVAMTCSTMRIEDDDRTLEAFRCRAEGAGRLPPGAYRPPGTTWNSDFDRRRAADHRIRISTSGEVLGWALYRP